MYETLPVLVCHALSVYWTGLFEQTYKFHFLNLILMFRKPRRRSASISRWILLTCGRTFQSMWWQRRKTPSRPHPSPISPCSWAWLKQYMLQRYQSRWSWGLCALALVDSDSEESESTLHDNQVHITLPVVYEARLKFTAWVTSTLTLSQSL